jgi:hypothetical protein
MFCQNCGAELTDEGQKFCQSCGSEIQDSSEETPETPEPTSEPPASSPVPVVAPTPISTEKFVSGETPYSKRVLGFAIASLIIGITTMIVAFNVFIIRRVAPPYTLGISIPVIIGIVSFYILGFIFGIVSRSNVSRADAEPENTIAKIGGVFGVFGIIINIVPMVVTIIVAIVRFVPLFFGFPFFP